jgi:hypothetical protein
MVSRKAVVGAAVAVALSAAGVAAQAAVLPVASLSITGGNFNMVGVGGAAIVGGPGQPLVAGTYQGTGVPGDSLTSFEFFLNPVSTLTAVSAPGTTGGPAPTGSVDDVAGTISMDMSSFIAFWNGTYFNQGSAAAAGTYNAGTGAYSLSWSSLITSPPFAGFTGSWTITGNASVVPLPAGVWLLGMGAAGLLGLARRREETAAA